MPKTKYKILNTAFTLIELLVVISIIGILIGVSIFGLQGARESSRNAKRKADLELIRTGLETYKVDCGQYPPTLASPLIGDDSSASCLSTNTYISKVPTDPTTPARDYLYAPSGYIYEICTSLEDTTNPDPVTCGGSSNCGEACNYKVLSP